MRSNRNNPKKRKFGPICGDTITNSYRKRQRLNDNTYADIEHLSESYFKLEVHPTKSNIPVISLLSEDELDDSHSDRSSSDPSSSSSNSNSSHSSENESIASVNDYVGCDPKGYIDFMAGLIICNKYKMIRELGKGTFSRVFECHARDNKDQKYAVKVIRNVYKYQLAAQTEYQILHKIRRHDPHKSSCCIHIIENDQYQGHPVFVFPLFSRSIYSFMVHNGYKPFCYRHIIDIMYQICCGVSYIHSLDIIITDLKPENILLVHDAHSDSHSYSSPYSTQIKLIDFGSAVLHKPGATHSHLIQTRHYRAPEVVFKSEWSFSVDQWSIGCILVELAYGRMLFNTHCSIDHLNQMVNCIGPPPASILEVIDNDTWSQYFDHHGALNMLKAKQSPVQCKKLHKYFNQNKQYLQLYQLCLKLLRWDPNDRITAKQALQIIAKYQGT